MQSLTNFKNNLNKLNLLRNKASFLIDDMTVNLTFPTIEDSLELDFNTFLTVISVKKKDIDVKALGIKAESDVELSMGLLLKSNFKTVAQKYFKRYVGDIEFSENIIKIGDKRITSKEYQFIIESMQVAMKKIPLPDLEKEKKEKEELDGMSEMERKMLLKQRAVEEKLAKAKQKKNDKRENGLSLDDVCLALMYHFPQLTIETILSMNFYTLTWYFSYVGQLDAHEVHRIAAGNGLLKNYKYFI